MTLHSASVQVPCLLLFQLPTGYLQFPDRQLEANLRARESALGRPLSRAAGQAPCGTVMDRMDVVIAAALTMAQPFGGTRIQLRLLAALIGSIKLAGVAEWMEAPTLTNLAHLIWLAIIKQLIVPSSRLRRPLVYSCHHQTLVHRASRTEISIT